MGVPSFYRWLTNKYPDVVVNAKEEKGESIDTSLPNPNGMEFDNLYLDMNAIIHPCFHPDDNCFPPTTFEEVFNNIFEYIDRLFNIVRPRKLLYMAIDGVAPRAKMNQQRARRFRTSKDNEIAEAEEERLRRQFEIEGKQVLPKQESEVSDSNIITPGTEFMHKLSKKLQSYILQRINNDAGWKDIKVILSDANVPGEGEHKIMSFIRLQRSCPDYNPNTRHCLYGLDADLIMLVLATHELHFSILREDVLVQEQKPICESALETSLHEAKNSSTEDVLVREQELNCAPEQESILHEAELISVKSRGCFNKTASLIKKPYQFLHVWILREYLELDMELSNLPENFRVDFERIIDDFIFMCFFAGNDFLPHMPTLEIHEGALDLLMHVYKKEFKNLGGYLVDMQRAGDNKAGYIKLKRVEKFILLVGTFEEKIFKKRSELQERKLRRLLADYADAKADEEEELSGKLELSTEDINCALHNARTRTSADSVTVSVEIHPTTNGTDSLTVDNSEILKNTKELKEKLRENIRKTLDVSKHGGFGRGRVRLGSVGWKERYYKEKFSADSSEDIESIRKAIVQNYTEGLCWVLLYYFSGVPSWTWFYPYHYGPFASDLKGLAQVRLNFQKGLPFKPFDQLMGVLPPRSAHALPKAYQALMTDEHSSIFDFYPADFEVDIDGKRQMWQGICKLSFIEEERLLIETRKLEKELKENEAIRNVVNVDQLFAKSSSKLGSQILSFYKNQAVKKQNETIKIDTSLSGGMNGFIRPKVVDSNAVNSDVPEDDNVLCVFYELPDGRLHIPRLLEGVDIPDKTVTEDGIVETQLWHESQWGRPGNRLQSQERYRKAINRPKSTSTNSSSGVTYKGAGAGWGAGRGTEYAITHNYGGHYEYRRSPFGHGDRVSLPFSSSARELKGPSSSWDTRMQVGHPVMSPCEQNFKSGTFRGTHDFNGEWKAVGSIQGEPKGFEDMRISKSSQGFNSYGRAQSVNHNAWSSRSGSTSNSNYEWRQSVQSAAAPFGQGRGRWQKSSTENTSHSWQPNQYLAATTSMEAGGRGPYVPNMAATVSMQAHGSGQYVPNFTATTSMQGRGRGQYVPNFAATTSTQAQGRGQYVPNWAANASMQGRGRGQYVPNLAANTGRGRGQYVPNLNADTSMQGRGRGQYVPNLNANTSMQGRGRGQYLPSLAAPASMQAHGRGQYVPVTSTPNWSSSNNPRTSGH